METAGQAEMFAAHTLDVLDLRGPTKLEPPTTARSVTRSAADLSSFGGTWVSVSDVLPADSPRVAGEDPGHVRLLASVETPLPPILIHRTTSRVIDGMHRLQAAIVNGRMQIQAEFFDGTEQDAFVEAVRRNVTHGRPLSVAERELAARRILIEQPHLSDRAVALICGLSGRTVAAVRRRSSAVNAQLDKRLGRDGKMHPVDGSEGRLRAAAVLRERPDAPLREVAAAAGVAPATAADVRERLRRGESPLTRQPATREPRLSRGDPSSSTRPDSRWHSAKLEALDDDRALQSTEMGVRCVDWLRARVVDSEDWVDFVAAIPLSRAYMVAAIARRSAEAWSKFAEALDERARNCR